MSTTDLMEEIGKLIHKKPLEQVREALGGCLLKATMQVFSEQDPAAAALELSETFKSFAEGCCTCCGEELSPTSTH